MKELAQAIAGAVLMTAIEATVHAITAAATIARRFRHGR